MVLLSKQDTSRRGPSLASKSDATVAKPLKALQQPARRTKMRRKGRGDSVIRYLVGAFTLTCACLLAFSSERSIAKDDAKPSTMRFEWRTEGPAEQCGRFCRRWVSAIGVVTDGTARDFETWAKDNGNVRGATLVLDSEGGSVLAALALGRAIRRLDMTTTVGKTTLVPPTDGGAPRAALSPKAQCESMCAFI